MTKDTDRNSRTKPPDRPSTGDLVTEVSERFGVSAHSLDKWVTAIELDETVQQGAASV